MVMDPMVMDTMVIEVSAWAVLAVLTHAGAIGSDPAASPVANGAIRRANPAGWRC
jgi:hypothetical protein